MGDAVEGTATLDDAAVGNAVEGKVGFDKVAVGDAAEGKDAKASLFEVAGLSPPDKAAVGSAVVEGKVAFGSAAVGAVHEGKVPPAPLVGDVCDDVFGTTVGSAEGGA